jgi:hypothetical protein
MTVYSEREVLEFLEPVNARGPSRARWRGNGHPEASERLKNASKE